MSEESYPVANVRGQEVPYDPEQLRRISEHPCFSEKACHSFGRMHLAVAPKCNIQCKYCIRDFDCVNEAYTCGSDCLCHLKVDGDEEESACTPCRSHADCSGGAFCRPIAAPDDEAEGDGDTAEEGEAAESDEPIGCCDATYQPPCRTNKQCPYAPLGTASYCDPQAGFCTFDCKTSANCDDTECCNCHGQCVPADECECAETVDGDMDMNCNGCEDCSWRGAGYYCNSLTGL